MKRTKKKAEILVVSSGCPSGIGPEVSVASAARLTAGQCVLIGDLATLRLAAECVGLDPQRITLWDGTPPPAGSVVVIQEGARLHAKDRRPGRPTAVAGQAQLAYINAAYALVRRLPGAALVTAPVSKSAIAQSGARGSARFRGHTEWLQRLDGAPSSIMCFVAPQLATSLVTTHLPLSRVPRQLTPERVARATIQLAILMRGMGVAQPRLAVCALNPHAGEGELLGAEEVRAIAPGVSLARRSLATKAHIEGPIGAETAYRKAYTGSYEGVVAMYHDQATIPMKLVAFGQAVNVTMGLGIVRTSVDHGTGYDIAWQNRADPSGMLSAMQLALRLQQSMRSSHR